MKLIPIYTRDILPNAKYMHDNDGRMDLLGQILFTGFEVDIPIRTRSPSELDTTVYPFTIMIRTYCRCNTALTMELLSNIGLTASQQVKEANKLLLKYQIQLEETK